MKHHRVGLLLACLLWASPAVAADNPWVGFDRNGDGRVTFEEVMRQLQPAIRKGFDAMDRNHDGALSAEDFDDVHDGVRRLHKWLQEMLRPFLDERQQDDGELI